MDLIDQFDLVTSADPMRVRMLAAFNELSRKPGLKTEKEWLGEAIEVLTAVTENLGDLAARSLALPALEPVREDFARTLQQAAVDAVERLEAGLTFHGGKRSPLWEALYAKLKLPALRRAQRKDFEKFSTDFEKRLNGTYVKRMLNEGGLDFAKPVVAQVRAALQAYRSSFAPAPLAPADAHGLEQELRAAASRLEVPMRQARLVSEAALAPLQGAFEASGLGHKPKRRAKVAAPVADAGPAPEASTPPGPPVDAPPEADATPPMAPEKKKAAAPPKPKAKKRKAP
jgi:hypothetical protein